MGKHLTQENRNTIETKLDQHYSFKQIARLLGKDCNTISREVRRHFAVERTGSFGQGFNDCALRFSCTKKLVCRQCFSRSSRKCSFCGKCTSCCTEYRKETCHRLSSPPYVCNGCPDRNKCRLEKHDYHAYRAQKQYKNTLSESRKGFDLTQEEIKRLDSIISPLVKKGQSVYHILLNHGDELMYSEKSIYTYINAGLFSCRNIDLPRSVRMRPRKSKSADFKVDKQCYTGRTYEDYQTFVENSPSLNEVQIDSVIGLKGGACLLTVHFVSSGLMLAFKRESNDSRSVTDIFNGFWNDLGSDLFSRLFPVVLADRGSEFSNPKALEFDENSSQRCHVFFCDPSCPWQKGECENNHANIRRIIPKGVDIGQYSQEQITLMMSHINSYARRNLGGKSPYEMFTFMHGDILLKQYGISKISPDEITLTPDLFK